jgi:hypothetical protein
VELDWCASRPVRPVPLLRSRQGHSPGPKPTADRRPAAEWRPTGPAARPAPTGLRQSAGGHNAGRRLRPQAATALHRTGRSPRAELEPRPSDNSLKRRALVHTHTGGALATRTGGAGLTVSPPSEIVRFGHGRFPLLTVATTATAAAERCLSRSTRCTGTRGTSSSGAAEDKGTPQFRCNCLYASLVPRLRPTPPTLSAGCSSGRES